MATADTAIRQMRNVVLVIGLAWLCVGVPVLIGIASVGGAVWTAVPVVLTLLGCALAIAGAAGTWLLQQWGPIAHVLGAVLILFKSFAYAGGTSALGVPWGYLLMLAIFCVVVAPNWPKFRGNHA